MSDSPDTICRAALADGKLLIQRAEASGECFFPPRLMEPLTGDTGWTWIEASGLGTVYSVTVVGQRPPAEPYNVTLVDLDEGVRLMSRIEAIAPDAIRIGQRVRLRIAREGEDFVPLFDPA